jgi:hypothetical protein
MFKTMRASAVSPRPAILILALFASASVLLCAQAQAAIYKCVDDAGRIEFTDANKRGCKLLDLPGTIVAPAQRNDRPARSGTSAAPAAASTPSEFPRVNTSQQRARDNDRREILEDELRNEEKRLAELRGQFNNGEPERQGGEKNFAKYQERVSQMRDSIARAEQNVQALRREIGTIK